MAKIMVTTSIEFRALQSEFYALKRRLRRARSDAEKDKILRSMCAVWLEAQSMIHSLKLRPQKLTVSSQAAQFFGE